MFSKVADELRQERRRAERALSPLERLKLAQRLGDEAVAMFAHVHGLAPGEAAAELSRRRQRGRIHSACATGR